jgi:hypothetical protein
MPKRSTGKHHGRAESSERQRQNAGNGNSNTLACTSEPTRYLSPYPGKPGVSGIYGARVLIPNSEKQVGELRIRISWLTNFQQVPGEPARLSSLFT